MGIFIDNPKQLWRMWSVRVQGIWAALCAGYLVMTHDQQVALLSMLGQSGEGAAAAVTLVAQVSAAFSAASIAARSIRQPDLHQPRA